MSARAELTFEGRDGRPCDVPASVLKGMASLPTMHIVPSSFSTIFGGAPKPYDWLGSGAVPPHVWRTTAYVDTVDGSGEVR